MSPLDLAVVIVLLVATGRIVGRLDELITHAKAIRQLAEVREVRERALFGTADAREELRK